MAIPGVTLDGGYAEYVVASHKRSPRFPTLDSTEAAPLLCAGITTFNALRNSGARAGDTVAILGIGGLGHLGVQFAAKMGFHTVAIARGADKEALAQELGAHHYIDSTKTTSRPRLQKLGGAKTILATVTNSDAMSAVIGGLGFRGNLVVVGVDGPDRGPAGDADRRQQVDRRSAPASKDSEDTLAFSASAACDRESRRCRSSGRPRRTIG